MNSAPIASPTAKPTPQSATAEQILDLAEMLIQTRSYGAFSYQDNAVIQIDPGSATLCRKFSGTVWGNEIDFGGGSIWLSGAGPRYASNHRARAVHGLGRVRTTTGLHASATYFCAERPRLTTRMGADARLPTPGSDRHSDPTLTSSLESAKSALLP
jgi:hypothetical protein